MIDSMRACLIKWRSLINTGKPNIVAVPIQAVCGDQRMSVISAATRARSSPIVITEAQAKLTAMCHGM